MRCLPISSLLFNAVLEFLTIATRQEKERKETQIGQEIKSSLFADDMIPYLIGLKEFTRKLLDMINNFIQVAGYQISSFPVYP
jgi:hypothetical protein